MIDEDNFLSKSAEAAWQKADAQMDAHMEEKSKNILLNTRNELNEIVVLVENSLAKEEPALQGAIEELVSKVESFRDGVELWREKAETSIKLIEEKQRSLASKLQTIITNAEQDRERLTRVHSQRATDVEKACERIRAELERTQLTERE